MTYLLQDHTWASQPHPLRLGRIGLCLRWDLSTAFTMMSVEFVTPLRSDEEALAAFDFLSQEEGIIPALESAHAIAEVVKLAPTMKKNQIIIVNLSGRGRQRRAAGRQDARHPAIEREKPQKRYFSYEQRQQIESLILSINSGHEAKKP